MGVVSTLSICMCRLLRSHRVPLGGSSPIRHTSVTLPSARPEAARCGDDCGGWRVVRDGWPRGVRLPSEWRLGPAAEAVIIVVRMIDDAAIRRSGADGGAKACECVP